MNGRPQSTAPDRKVKARAKPLTLDAKHSVTKILTTSRRCESTAFVNSTKEEKAMSEQLNLTVINNSVIDLTFAVFAKLPTKPDYGTVSLAWLLQQINKGGNNHTFTWNTDWAFIWSAMGTEVGYQWVAKGKPLPANPNSDATCAAVFSYNGDFTLTYGPGTSDGKTLRVTDTPQIPTPDIKQSSVGLALNGSAICATQAGPNLHQAFTLHPTYYIGAGTYVKGEMVDISNSTDFQVLTYENGNIALTAILNKDNTWSVKPSQEINFGSLTGQRVLASR